MQLDLDNYQIKATRLAPQAGRMLISEPFLYDDCFHRSVTLLVEKSTDGYMGLVQNKRSEATLNDLIEDLIMEDEIPLFIGGPVHPDQLYYIHTLGDLIPNAISIGDGLYIDGDFDIIISYIKGGNQLEGCIKFFIGHAVWSHPLLRSELKDCKWLVTHGNSRIALSYDTDMMWKKMLKSLDKEYQGWLYYPAQPTMN